MSLTFIDWFAGIGGFRLGLEQAGHKAVGWIEWDKHARKSYEAIHQPEGEWTHDDVRTVDYRELPRADIWTFGFPCQDISVAGNQTGFSGERSSLFFAVTKRLRQIKEWDSSRMPSYLLIENVKNFLSVNDGWDFLLAQVELDAIGYDTEWQVLNSKDFGVPQNRERVFIVGHLRNRGTRKIFPLRRKNEKINRKLVSIGNTNPSGNGMNGQVYDSRGLAPTLTTNKGEGPKVMVRACLTPDREKTRQQGRRFKEDGEPAFTLNTQDRHGVAIKDGSSWRIRKLTPRECWRLQSFPDWAFDRAEAAGVSPSQLYKQAGNSVTVNVIYEIAKRMQLEAVDICEA